MVARLPCPAPSPFADRKFLRLVSGCGLGGRNVRESGGTQPMRRSGKKVYISVDFEGAACVIGQPQDPTQPLGSGLECSSAIFAQAQRLVTAETNAAVRGALAAGATEIIVEDDHGSGHNLLYEQLHPEARVIMGGPR